MAVRLSEREKRFFRADASLPGERGLDMRQPPRSTLYWTPPRNPTERHERDDALGHRLRHAADGIRVWRMPRVINEAYARALPADATLAQQRAQLLAAQDDALAYRRARGQLHPRMRNTNFANDHRREMMPRFFYH